MASASAKRNHRQRSERPEQKQRFYLLPGQGGSGYRRKQRLILKSSIIVGVIASLIFAAIMFFVYRAPH